MAWSVPRTWVTSEIVTSTVMNQHVRDQFRELWHELHVYTNVGDLTVSPEGAWNGFFDFPSLSFAGHPVRLELAAAGIFHTGDSTASPGVDQVRIADHTAGTPLQTIWKGHAKSDVQGELGGFYAQHRWVPPVGVRTYGVQGNPFNATGADSLTLRGPIIATIWEKGG